MTIGYTTGVFDMFHIGHLNLLRRAREQCDFLIVEVSTDELVREYKHKNPVIPFSERLEIVRAIRYVDGAIPQTSHDKKKAWDEIHFDMLFHGTDWKGSELYEKIGRDMDAVGARIVWIPHTDGISSSDLERRLGERK